MFAVIFICGNVFVRIAGKIAKIAKIRTRKNFVPHGKTQSVGFRLHLYNQRYFSSPRPAKSYNYAKKKTNKQTETGHELVFISGPLPNYSQTSLYGHPVYTDSFQAILFFFSVQRRPTDPNFWHFQKKSNDVVKPFFS